MARLSIATKARLPSSLRIETTNASLAKSIGRLSREGLILLALDWLDPQSLAFSAPYLAPPPADDGDGAAEDTDSTDLYPPCRSIEELRDLYTDLQQQRGARRDIVSRVLEGDWRHGLTLYQIAMLDFAYFDEHRSSQKWTAYRIQPLKTPNKGADDEVLKVNDKSLAAPRFHPSTFLQSLQEQVLPDIKAHYHFSRPKDLPVLLLRIFAVESPYNTDLALSGSGSGTTNFTASRTVYLAFPDGSPSLFISKAQATGPISLGESKSLYELISNGVPHALSRPRERFTLKPANLISRNLEALLDKKGSGRTNAAGGGWSIYASGKDKKSPLDVVLPTPPLSRESSRSGKGQKRQRPLSERERVAKRARLVAKARFGTSGKVTDGKGIERLEIIMQDPYPVGEGQTVDDSDSDVSRRREARRSRVDNALQRALAKEQDDDIGDVEPDSSQWTPTVRLTFQGSHVFAGIRQLVEAGIIDGERMPGWMTGEEGVTSGVVRHGLIRGHKGSGL